MSRTHTIHSAFRFADISRMRALGDPSIGRSKPLGRTAIGSTQSPTGLGNRPCADNIREVDYEDARSSPQLLPTRHIARHYPNLLYFLVALCRCV